MSFPTPFFYLMEGLTDVKEKAASLDAATVKMKLEDHTPVAVDCFLLQCCVSCRFLVLQSVRDTTSR